MFLHFWCRLRTARSMAFSPLRFLVRGSIPCWSNNNKHSMAPLQAAACRGVSPRLSLRSSFSSALSMGAAGAPVRATSQCQWANSSIAKPATAASIASTLTCSDGGSGYVHGVVQALYQVVGAVVPVHGTGDEERGAAVRVQGLDVRPVSVKWSTRCVRTA
jgi:hypothetical protein